MSRIFRRRDPDGDLIKVWYCWIPDLETGGTRRVSTKCTDKAAAQKRADELERDAVDPDSAAQAKATLRDALDLLIRDRDSLAKGGKRSYATVEFYRKKSGILLGAVPEVLGHDEGAIVFLREVTGKLVDDYIITRRDDGVVDSTIQKELTTWRAAMRLAKRRRLWKGDLEETFPKFGANYEPRSRWVRPEEIWKLRDAFVRTKTKKDGSTRFVEHGVALWGMCAFMIATSCEWGAAWKVNREKDFDLSDPSTWLVHVRGTKKKTRDRWVPILHLPFAFLLADAIALGDGVHSLFLDRSNNFRTRLTEACVRAGIDHLSPNDLRRTHGKWLRLAGVTPSVIGTSLGHADGRMAERVYAKSSPRELAGVQRAELAAHFRELNMGNGTVETVQTESHKTIAKEELEQ